MLLSFKEIGTMTAQASPVRPDVADITPRASSLVSRLAATTDDVAPLVARVALGLVMFPHGAQKALGWFGGYGLEGTMGFFTQKMGIPAPFAALAIAAELLGAIGLVTGLLSRVAAFGIAATMAVAIAMVHLPVGFFMNWTGAQAGEGFEYHLLAIALAVIVMVKGGGRWSLDRLVSSRLGKA
jgi:putative oxidoreductase